MGQNHTYNKFILLGITDRPFAQIPLFGLFFLIYTVTLAGNIGIMVLVWTDPRLHTPMYFFLTHLSFTDACYSTVVTPKMLVDLLLENKTISFAGCVTQFYGFAFFATAECYLLAVMAYDRYVAICNPLLYVMIISQQVRTQLVAASYLIGFLSAVIYTGCTFGGSFCGPNLIDHFFCDSSPVLKLACSDTHRNEMVILVLFVTNVVGTNVIVLLSYSCILSTVLRMRSAQNRSRAFSTCASHLMAVSLYYGTGFFMYLQPSSSHTSLDKVVSVFYTLVTPMLNPPLYSLRNREVKDALRQLTACSLHSLA
ncbi:olfactory receptor 5AP2-like [Dromaius novaehollandiae]|uniref:olfactory receptor 5AP2-like n=1 Tax=Dromaius novaehollandiae TaxID=8790 RepID=UPI00311D8263